MAIEAPGDFDTHANHIVTFDRNLRAIDTALAFQRDLEARGLAGRVLTHVTARCSSSGWAVTRSRSSPAPPSSRVRGS